MKTIRLCDRIRKSFILRRNAAVGPQFPSIGNIAAMSNDWYERQN